MHTIQGLNFISKHNLVKLAPLFPPGFTHSEVITVCVCVWSMRLLSLKQEHIHEFDSVH